MNCTFAVFARWRTSDLEFEVLDQRPHLLLQPLLLLLQDVGDVVALRRVLGVPPLLLLQICYDLQPPPRGDTESGMARRQLAVLRGQGRLAAARGGAITALRAKGSSQR